MSKWIDVNDRLPESNVNVLWIGAKNGMFIGYTFNDKYSKECAMRDGKVCVSVPNGRNLRQGVAWMPLPEPYKKEVE